MKRNPLDLIGCCLTVEIFFQCFSSFTKQLIIRDLVMLLLYVENLS